MNSNEKNTIRPTFDARLQYYDVLQKYLITVSESRLSSDYALWERSLRGLLDMVRPYIKEEEYKELKKNLDKARQLHPYSYSCIYNNKILCLLDDTNSDLLLYAKKMMLPSSEDENTEFDEEEFLRGSSA